MSDKTLELPDGLDLETARSILGEYARTDNAQIVATDTLESLRNEIDEFKGVFAELLAEDSPHSADTLARMDAEALTEPFKDDDGDIDIDTLRQEPETGDVSGDGGDGDGNDLDIDSLSVSDKEYLTGTVLPKIRSFEQRGMDASVENLKADVLEHTGGEDFEAAKAALEAL